MTSDLVIEFIMFALQLLFWYTLSSIFLHVVLWRAEKRNEELTEILHHVHEIVHRVRIEEHYNNFYWYDADSDKFLAQGATPTELIDRLKVRFPKHIFLLEDKDSVIKLSGPDWKMTKVARFEPG